MGDLTLIGLATVAGYLIGSTPTANVIASFFGLDLRADGTGNPGANNARRLGGNLLAALVLVVEFGKGALAVWVGASIGGGMGAALAGVGAAAGNVYNVWYRFDGGKGLGITGGVMVAIWPVALPFLIAVLIAATAVSRSSGKGTLTTITALVVLAVGWGIFRWPIAWGVGDDVARLVLSLGLVAVLTPKHLHDARFPVRPT